jgi:hypothetical protein
MKLELQPIESAKECLPEQLRIVNIPLTDEDVAEYEAKGWKYFRKEDFIETHLPELGNPLCFSNKFSLHKGIVIEIKGKHYHVSFEESDAFEPFEAKGKYITLTPTTEPLSVPDLKFKGDNETGHYLKFFGQPAWIQGEYYPTDLNGNPCYHLVTIENMWGDCGNYNILIGFDGDTPNVAYFEASCC